MLLLLCLMMQLTLHVAGDVAADDADDAAEEADAAADAAGAAVAAARAGAAAGGCFSLARILLVWAMRVATMGRTLVVGSMASAMRCRVAGKTIHT